MYEQINYYYYYYYYLIGFCEQCIKYRTYKHRENVCTLPEIGTIVSFCKTTFLSLLTHVV